jgi:hypothetical protein
MIFNSDSEKDNNPAAAMPLEPPMAVAERLMEQPAEIPPPAPKEPDPNWQFKKKKGAGKRPTADKARLAEHMAQYDDGSYVRTEKALMSFEGGPSKGAMGVYLYLSSFYNPQRDPFPSEKKIASFYNCSPSSVRKDLRELAAWGLVIIKPLTVGRSKSYELPYHAASLVKDEERQIDLRKKLINKNWVKGR